MAVNLRNLRFASSDDSTQNESSTSKKTRIYYPSIKTAPSQKRRVFGDKPDSNAIFEELNQEVCLTKPEFHCVVKVSTTVIATLQEMQATEGYQKLPVAKKSPEKNAQSPDN